MNKDIQLNVKKLNSRPGKEALNKRLAGHITGIPGNEW